MKNKFWQTLLLLMMLVGLLAGLGGVQLNGVEGAQAKSAPQEIQPTLQADVSQSIHHDISPRLIDIEPSAYTDVLGEELTPRLPLGKSAVGTKRSDSQEDDALQVAPAAANMPAPYFNFNGIDNRNIVLPPDTNGDVGPNHYVQWVNVSMAIWTINRGTGTATLAYGPANGNALWSGFGGACETTNDGDPIVLYDELAERWLISQFALPNYPNGPFYECIAISASSDPTAIWYRYAFQISATKMNDYPKFGVWPDAYYMSVNQFEGGNWGGAGAVAFEREKMLQGLPARMIYFDLYGVNPNYGGMLPSDLDGPPPPPGTPNYFISVDDASYAPPDDALRIWEFHVDWSDTSKSTFGNAGNPNTILKVAEFTPLCLQDGKCIPQPDVSQKLDVIADRLMHRLQYRYFGTHSALVTNHTVDVGGERAGVRWYEVRNSTTGWAVHQQGTYAGDAANGEHRWMGSVAMDNAGNMALGYSVSSTTVYPSIRYTGRLVGDPLGNLPQGETTLIAGAGSQTNAAGRWGDYSMMSVDPTDDCTFWYTQQYYEATSDANWQTRIGSFTFPTCLANAQGSLQGRVTNASNGNPLAGVHINANGFSTTSDSDGYYQFYGLTVGTYSVTAALYDYQPQTTSADVKVNPVAIQDFALSPATKKTASGVVSDGSGQGWPLYAQIDITALGFAKTIFTNPVNGTYSVELSGAYTHTLTVNAVSPGYQEKTVQLSTADADWTRNISLLVNSTLCSAPGYKLNGTCNPVPGGGLLVGNVYDANNLQGLIGATVQADIVMTDTTTTIASPGDPAVEDGFYTLFSSQAGALNFTASKMKYGDDTRSASAVAGGVVARDFTLPAGLLASIPHRLDVALDVGEVVTRPLTISNTGGLPAAFTLTEVNAPALQVAVGPFAAPLRRVSPKRLAAMDASAVYTYQPPEADQLTGGQVQQSWATGLEHAWGIGYDMQAKEVWVGDVAQGDGADILHSYLPDGTPSGAKIDRSGAERIFAADMAYNPYTGALWQVDVAVGNCLVELDPASQTPMGEKLCPAFDHSQRGLAYNPLDRSFYSGSWTNGILYHFDERGVILDSYNLFLNISGLAFNPATGHLFVLSSANKGFDVYVLDVNNEYQVLGGFDIPGLSDFGQAGMAIDCSGALWVVDQSTGTVLQVDSGEHSPCAWNSVPWMSVTPAAGALAANQGQVISVNLDANFAVPGLNAAQVVVTNDTPYGTFPISVTLFLKQYGVTVSPPTATGFSGPGTDYIYSLSVNNTGNYTDTYSLAASGNQWPVTVPPTAGPAAPSASAAASVTVSVPATAPIGGSDTVAITATSLSDPTKKFTATLNTTSGYLTFLPLVAR